VGAPPARALRGVGGLLIAAGRGRGGGWAGRSQAGIADAPSPSPPHLGGAALGDIGAIAIGIASGQPLQGIGLYISHAEVLGCASTAARLFVTGIAGIALAVRPGLRRRCRPF